MCGIWDCQSTIVKDLNDSQDPKHTLFCRENPFVAICALFRQQMSPFYPIRGGGEYSFWIDMNKANSDITILEDNL